MLSQNSSPYTCQNNQLIAFKFSLKQVLRAQSECSQILPQKVIGWLLACFLMESLFSFEHSHAGLLGPHFLIFQIATIMAHWAQLIGFKGF